jgi:Ser/Thr protein kinase RdoA (MazF antagonist)
METFETLTSAGQLRRLRRLAVKALAAFDIHESHMIPLQHEANTTFRVDLASGERYVLRIHYPALRTVESVRSEMMWLAALRRDTEYIVPEPVRTPEGDLLTVASFEDIPGPRICVLFHWIDGRFLDARLTPFHLERVGAFMAGLQLHAARFKAPDEFIRGRVDNLTETARRMAARGISEAVARRGNDNPEDETTAIRLVNELCPAEDAERVSKLIRRFREAQGRTGQSPDSFGLIHADLHQENYFFQHDQVRAIDFDDCGYGHYLYDIAVTLSEVNWRKNTPELRKGFLTGYRSIRDLSSEDEGYLDTFMTFRDLQLMIWFMEMRNHPAFRDKWASDVKTILNDIRTFLEN